MESRKCFKNFVTFMLVFCFMSVFIPKQALAGEQDWRNDVGESFRLKNTEELKESPEYDLWFTITKKAENGNPGQVCVSGLVDSKLSIKKIELPKAVTNSATKCKYNVTSIKKESFSGSKIDEFILHDGITEIGEKAFQSSSLKEIVIPESVKKIGAKAFSFCYNLEKISVNEENPNYYSKDDTFLLSKDGKTLFSVANIGDVVSVPYGVKKVTSCALSSNIFFDEDNFNKYTKIKKIVYPSTIRYIEDHNLNSYIVVFKGKTIPKIYENDLVVNQLVAPKEALDGYKKMQYEGKNVFSSGSRFNTKIPYASQNKKFLSKLNPEEYTKNNVYYKEISAFTKKFLKSLKKKNPDITEREIVIEVFRYIRKNYEFDFSYYHEELNNPKSRTARFLFENKSGNVNSFVSLAQYILRDLNIPCVAVTYTTNDNEYNSELENAVYIEGNWIIVNFRDLAFSTGFDSVEVLSINRKLTNVWKLD